MAHFASVFRAIFAKHIVPLELTLNDREMSPLVRLLSPAPLYDGEFKHSEKLAS